MTLVGVGLVVYRWPWVVDSQARIGPIETRLQGELTEPFLRHPDGTAVKRGPLTNPAAFLNPTHFRDRRQSIQVLHTNQAEIEKLRRQTTYRRGWNGEPERHGVQRYWKEDGTLVAEVQFFEGEQRQVNRLDPSGEIMESSSFEDGVLQGPYFCRIGPRTWQGAFHQGKRAGQWQFTFRDGNEVTRSRQPLADGVPNGEWTWLAADDQVLQSARFDRGKLVLWNGRPVQEELQRWCEARRVDPTMREALFTLPQTQSSPGADLYWQFAHFSHDPATLPLKFNEHDMLLVHSPRMERSYEFLDRLDKSPTAGKSIGEEIVEELLRTSRTFDFRFGVLCVVPICSSEVYWRDRTGVSRVQFPKGSWQDQSWNKFLKVRENHHVPEDLHLGVARQLNQLFAPTAIEMDTSELTTKSLADIRNIGSLCIGTPRDILGLFLASNNWSCEQRGNVLVLHPWPAEIADE